MFNVQKDYVNHEIYIYYNEFLAEDEDESVSTLENILGEDSNGDYIGVIDLITVKSLSQLDIDKIKSMYKVLKGSAIKNLSIISDNKKILNGIKRILPGVQTELLKIK